jgi:hypothetical protein
MQACCNASYAIRVRNTLISHDIPSYPDTTVWVTQFNYAFNEPIALQYFWFQGFNRYPVVGITWNQANAFCEYRTNKWRSERERTQACTSKVVSGCQASKSGNGLHAVVAMSRLTHGVALTSSTKKDVTLPTSSQCAAITQQMVVCTQCLLTNMQLTIMV